MLVARLPGRKARDRGKVRAAQGKTRMPTILVVDDEPLIRWALREGLEGAGFAVIEAGSARETLESLDRPTHPVTVALLDVRLPDSDDLGLLRRIRQSAPDCRVIMMTAHGAPDLLAEALTAGAFDAISKPFDIVRVVNLVRAAQAAA